MGNHWAEWFGENNLDEDDGWPAQSFFWNNGVV